MADTELAGRVFAAINALEQKLKRRITLAELGQRVATHLGEAKPTAESVIARWAKGKQVPRSRDGWTAFAAALEVDPGWLTYGTGTMTPTDPAAPPMYYGTAAPAAAKQAQAKPAAKKKRRPRKAG